MNLDAIEDRAVIEVRDEADAEVLRFRRHAMLFTDQSYRLLESPERLTGEPFLRSSTDYTRFDVVESGHLMILTPSSNDNANSETASLEAQGFSLVDVDRFQLFENKIMNQVQVYKKEVSIGDSYEFGEWVIVLGFEDARSTIDRVGAAREKPYHIYPLDIPNTGILFVDQEKDNRSGHGGITLTEASNGDILAFYSVTWAESWGGHGVGGWSKYRRSTDGGLTWGEPIDFDYSLEMWNDKDIYSSLVFSVVTAPDGTLIATLMRYKNMWWEKKKAPVYLLSHDHGHTWDGPHFFDEDATVEDISMTLNTHFVHDDEVFLVFRGGRSNMSPGGPHTLWVSSDNGERFHQRSMLPFNEADYYWAAGVLDDDEIIVYTYSAHHLGGDPHHEKNIPYTISRDGGRTWSPVQTTHFAKGIRNMQFSGKLDDYFFINGRSGSIEREQTGNDPGPHNFVLYLSKDGVHWDEGIVLMSRMQTPGGGDSYSANEIIGKYDPATPEHLLIQADVSYNDRRTNMHHWWITLKPMHFDDLHDTK